MCISYNSSRSDLKCINNINKYLEKLNALLKNININKNSIVKNILIILNI